MRPDPSTGYPGRTHRFYTGTPVWPFGAGLSYTSFERELAYKESAPSPGAVSMLADGVVGPGGSSSWSDSNDEIVVSVQATVRNTGSMRGDDVVMVFLEPPAEAVALGAPKQQLAAFARVSLAPQEETVVHLDIQRRHLRVPAAAYASATTLPWKVRLNDDNVDALLLNVE